jgi:hypothetical protein
MCAARRIRKPDVVARNLSSDDPRNLDHPSHKAQWLELARVLGRMDARKDFEAIYGRPPPKGTPDDRLKTKARKRGADT